MTETLVIFGAGSLSFAAGMMAMFFIARDYGKTTNKLMADAHNRLMSHSWTDYAGITSLGEDQPTSTPLNTRRSDRVEAMIERGEWGDGENS